MTETGARFLDRGTPPKIGTLIVIISLSVLSMNAFIPSLPAMAEDLRADYAFIQLAVPGYLAMVATLQLFIGPLSDRYGRRPVLLTGISVFTLASVGCVLAPDAETFMVFRMIQATVAVGMVLARAVVRDMYEGAEAAAMIGYVSAAMAVVPMAAPLFGGFLEATLGWRATFVSFALAGVVVAALTWFDLGETNKAKSVSFAAQFRAYPGLLTAPRFWGYTLTAAFASGSFFALLGGGPFVAREIFKLSPEMTGVALGFISLGYLLGNLVTGRTAARIGVNGLMLTGCLIASAGMLAAVAVGLAGIETPYTVFGFSIFVGFGNGLTMPASTTGIMSVRPNLAGSASGLGAALQIGGGAALSAITGALLTVETGAMPLVAMMAASAVCSVATTLFVIWRARVVARRQPA